MKKICLLIAISAFMFSSCKKKDEEKNCSFTEANLAGSYKLASVKYKASGSTTETDYSQYLDGCEKDDLWTFTSDHAYVYSDVGVICSPNGDDQGMWSLNGNNLSIDGDELPLENFSCSGFSIIVEDLPNAGDKLSINLARQ